jgi:hypothetical protein
MMRYGPGEEVDIFTNIVRYAPNRKQASSLIWYVTAPNRK